MELRLGARTMSLERSRVMGILNVTPDSFSDGGQFLPAADGYAMQAVARTVLDFPRNSSP